MKSFKKVRKFLDQIPNINRGGCGVAALAMYYVAKKEGKKVGIAYLYRKGWDDYSMEQNNKFKEGKIKTAVGCAHVLVRVDNKYYDSEGRMYLSTLKSKYHIDKSITKKHLITSLNNRDEWNDDFNREAHLPKIEKFINKKLPIDCIR